MFSLPRQMLNIVFNGVTITSKRKTKKNSCLIFVFFSSLGTSSGCISCLKNNKSTIESVCYTKKSPILVSRLEILFLSTNFSSRFSFDQMFTGDSEGKFDYHRFFILISRFSSRKCSQMGTNAIESDHVFERTSFKTRRKKES